MMNRTRVFVTVLALVVTVVAGCAAPAARLRVDQPGVSDSQRELSLSSNWSYFSRGPEKDRYVLSFPLPGALGGDEHYVLYLRVAAGKGQRGAGLLLPEAPRFDGFFVQARGQRKGLTTITAGLIEITGVAFGGEDKRRIELQAQCEDGTILAGDCKVTYERFRVRDFEDRYATDIAALDGPKLGDSKEDQGG